VTHKGKEECSFVNKINEVTTTKEKPVGDFLLDSSKPVVTFEIKGSQSTTPR
jgi:hypothetical protein